MPSILEPDTNKIMHYFSSYLQIFIIVLKQYIYTLDKKPNIQEFQRKAIL